MAGKILEGLKDAYEVLKKIDNRYTLDIFKDVIPKNKGDKKGVELILQDNLKIIGVSKDFKRIIVSGAEIKINEEEGGDGSPNKEKILKELNQKMSKSYSNLIGKGISIGTEDKNPYENKKFDEDLEF